MTRSYPAVFFKAFQKSIMKRFGKNRTILVKNTPSWILNRALNTPL